MMAARGWSSGERRGKRRELSGGVRLRKLPTVSKMDKNKVATNEKDTNKE